MQTRAHKLNPADPSRMDAEGFWARVGAAGGGRGHSLTWLIMPNRGGGQNKTDMKNPGSRFQSASNSLLKQIQPS